MDGLVYAGAILSTATPKKLVTDGAAGVHHWHLSLGRQQQDKTKAGLSASVVSLAVVHETPSLGLFFESWLYGIPLSSQAGMGNVRQKQLDATFATKQCRVVEAQVASLDSLTYGFRHNVLLRSYSPTRQVLSQYQYALHVSHDIVPQFLVSVSVGLVYEYGIAFPFCHRGRYDLYRYGNSRRYGIRFLAKSTPVGVHRYHRAGKTKH